MKAEHLDPEKTFQRFSITALTASDLNSKYLSCVPYFIEFWLSFCSNSDFQIEPRVLLVADRLPEELADFQKYIELVSHTENLNSAYVAQCIRLFWPAFDKNNIVITTDVDMFPLSDRILKNSIKNFANINTFVIYRDILENDQYPICYNIASPTTWRNLMWNNQSKVKVFDFLFSELQERGGISSYAGQHGGTGWTIDQELLWKRVQISDQINFVKIQKGQVFFKRLDRSRHRNLFKWLCLPLVLFNVFDDYHVHHPVEQNRKYIRAIFCALKAKNVVTYRYRLLKSKTLSLISKV
jgi:hypothetical protein